MRDHQSVVGVDTREEAALERRLAPRLQLGAILVEFIGISDGLAADVLA